MAFTGAGLAVVIALVLVLSLSSVDGFNFASGGLHAGGGGLKTSATVSLKGKKSS
jgi:hypothetical protein